MKTPGKIREGLLYTTAQDLPDTVSVNLDNVPCEGGIHVSSAFIGANSWYDQDNPGRPYMHLIGECRTLKGDMPYGVTELTFDEGKGIRVDIFYEFTDNELADLVHKGLYKPGFTCPDVLYTNTLDMPLTCNFTAVAPQEDSPAPIVFADIADRQCVVTTSAECGYRFADYFTAPITPVIEDEFYDFNDLEITDDLLEQPHAQVPSKVDEPEVTPPTEQELVVAQHYKAIHERVMEKHVDKPVEQPVQQAVQEDAPNGVASHTPKHAHDELTVASDDVLETTPVGDDVLEPAPDVPSETPAVSVDQAARVEQAEHDAERTQRMEQHLHDLAQSIDQKERERDDDEFDDALA